MSGHRGRVGWLLVGALLLGGCSMGGAPATSVTGERPAAGAAPAAAARETSPPREALRVAYTAPSAAQTPLWVAVEAGLLAEQGLDVEVLRLDGSGRAIPALLSGELALSLLNGSAAATAAAQGADAVLIANGTSRLAFQIMSAPNVTGFEQLRGQSVGTTGLGSSSDYAMRWALRHFGLDPERDVTVRSIGGGEAQLVAAVQQGAVLASALSPPADYHGEQVGLRSLARLGEMDIPYQGVALGTTRGYIARNRATVLRFLRGYVAAVQRIKADVPFTLGVIREYTKLDDERALEWGYKQYMEPLNFPPYPSEPGLQAVIDSLVATTPEVEKVRPADLLDISLLQELEAEGFMAR